MILVLICILTLFKNNVDEYKSTILFSNIIKSTVRAGKYEMLDLTLNMLKEKGFYIIDDMLPQPNWPKGHEKKAEKLIEYLHSREDLEIVNLGRSSGVIVCVKK